MNQEAFFAVSDYVTSSISTIQLVNNMQKACCHSNPKESISIQDALRMCTYNGYFTTFDENERGSLEVGKVADMVLLDQNPYTIPKEKLSAIQVKQLYLQGREYEKTSGNGVGQILRGILGNGKC